MDEWIDACSVGDVETEEAIRFDHAGKTFAIYRDAADRYYATDGLCTHEAVHLSGGFVDGHVIECPKHAGRFDYTTGEAVGAPVCINLRVYAVKIEGERVRLKIA